MADLGLGDRLVASVQPEVLGPPFNKLPSLGSLYLPNVERLLRFRVDEVVIDRSLFQTQFEQTVKNLRLPYTSIHITSLDSLLSESTKLQNKYGGEINSAIQQCVKALAARPASPRFSFLLLAWTSPAMAFGDRTLLSDILRALGGENIIPSSWDQSYPQLSVEWLLNHRPDRVYVVTYDERDIVRARKDIRHWWPEATNLIPMSLDANRFSHANFSPIKALSDLQLKLPGGCR